VSAIPVLDPLVLVGRWSLDRTLRDRATGQCGCVHGTLDIAPSDNGLDWVESGELTWGDFVGPVSRALRLVRLEDGWWVTFSDGRAFHPWRPGVEVAHPCRADLYRGTITVDADAMRIVWDVVGPAKDHRYVTRLRRL